MEETTNHRSFSQKSRIIGVLWIISDDLCDGHSSHNSWSNTKWCLGSWGCKRGLAQCSAPQSYGHTRKSWFWKLLSKAAGVGGSVANRCTLFTDTSLGLHKQVRALGCTSCPCQLLAVEWRAGNHSQKSSTSRAIQQLQPSLFPSALQHRSAF